MNRDSILLAIAAVSSTTAFSVAYQTPGWIMLLPLLAAPWSIDRMPGWLMRVVRSSSQAACLASVILGMFMSFFPVDPAFGLARSPVVLGYFTVLLIAVLFFGRRVWKPEMAMIPAILGLLIPASFKLRVNLLPYIAIDCVCFFIYLTPSSWTVARVRRLVLHSAMSLALAYFGARGLWMSQDWIEGQLYGIFSAASTVQPGLFADAQLGSLEELKLSPRVVLRVWSERPQKLRGRAFPFFDGRTWHAHETMKGRPDSPAFGAVPVDSLLAADEPDAVLTTIVPRAPDRVILAPGGALSVAASDPLRMDAYQVLTWTASASDRYVVRHRRNGRMVRPGGDPLPRWRDSGEKMREMCLRLPSKVDPRVESLAAKLAGEAAEPDQRLRHTVEYLRTNYSYTLKPGKFKTGDAMAEFLFDKRQGYCEYFATSAAVLLRLQGVPTRYITGYSVQSGNRKGDHYVVREKDGHAWIEAYIEGQGWIEADPTPTAEYEAMVAGERDGFLDDAWESLQVTAQSLMRSFQAGDWRGMLRVLWAVVWRVLGTGAAVFGIVRLWRWWRGRNRVVLGSAKRAGGVRIAEPLDPSLAALLAAIDRRWMNAGFPRPPSRAPLEHALTLREDEVTRQAIERIYRACFGSAPLSAQEVADLRQAFTSVVS